MKTMTKKIAAAGMAFAVAATAIPFTATDADAGWRGRHHYHHYHRHHRGDALAAGVLGLAAGAIIGGAIANSQPAPVYRYQPAPVYQPVPVYRTSDWDAYCFSKYRSYDPYSGTYLGYDGYRHPCR